MSATYPLKILNQTNIINYDWLTAVDVTTFFDTAAGLAIGVYDVWFPIGLGLARVSPDGKQAQILSIGVAPAYRKRGIATLILMRLESELAKQGVKLLQTSYSSQEPLQIERVLQKCGWDTPTEGMTLFKASVITIQKATWLHNLPPLPIGYATFLWVTLNETKRQAVEHLQSNDERYAASRFSRLSNLIDFDPATSLGLSYEGEVVGWLITQPMSAKNTLCYSNLFVRPDQRRIRRSGLGFSLVAQAVERQIANGGEYGVWYISPYNKQMLKINRRYLEPYLVSSEPTKNCSKEL